MSTTGAPGWALAEAQRLATSLSPGACSQSNALISALRSAGDAADVERCLDMLNRDLPAGGSAKPWNEFRRVVTSARAAELVNVHGKDGLIEVLTWIKRIGRVRQAEQAGRPVQRGAPIPKGRRR